MTPSPPEASRPPERPLEILMAGTFDVRNYGDLLFPIVAQHKLGPGFSIRAASPSGNATGWQDTHRVEPLAAALMNDHTIAGILIGGGNIIHAAPVDLPDYVAAGVANWAYPALWIGATVAASVRGIPVAWNAPGIPQPFPAIHRQIAARTASAASYLSVRDRASADCLVGLAPYVAVVPDPVLQLAEVWPKPSLEAHFRNLLTRCNLSADAGFVALHVKKRSLRSTPRVLARSLAEFSARHGVVPIVIGIGACHGDDGICDGICSALGIPHVNLSRPLGLKEIAAAIAFSRAYVGASMHGYITAAAYGVPATVVAHPPQPKFAGLLQHLGRKGDEASHWDEGLGKAALRLGMPEREVPEGVLRNIDTHWKAIRQTFAR